MLSTHTVTATKCVGRIKCQVFVFGPRSIGSNATTIGISRIALSDTAAAASIATPPPPSAVSRIICAGAAHTSVVASSAQSGLKFRSCASAPTPR